VYDEQASGGPCANPECEFPARRDEQAAERDGSVTWQNACLGILLAPLVLIGGAFLGGFIGGLGGGVVAIVLGAVFILGVAGGGLET
jgi:hypothetical protein